MRVNISSVVQLLSHVLHVLINIFFRYSRPNGEEIDEFEIEDDTHQTIGRCRCLESHNPTEEAIATSGHLAVERGEELVVIQSDFGSGWTYVQGKAM